MIARNKMPSLKPAKNRYIKAFELRNNRKLIAAEINFFKRTLYRKRKCSRPNLKKNKMMTDSLINWTLNTINLHQDNFVPPYDMLESIGHLEALPELSDIGLRIMQLVNDPLANTTKLAAVIELDPLLKSQIMLLARSSDAFPGSDLNVEESITEVLGFDFAFNLTLVLTAVASLKVPKEGSIGSRLYWIHAIASMQLLQLLNNQLDTSMQFQYSELVQSGLLHNIGLLLLGHQFPIEYGYLNDLIEANPTIPIIDLERFALGIDHNILGAWLMRFWDMPKPIVDVVYNHHNPNYRGENYKLNLLIYLNDCLLGKLGIGQSQKKSYSDQLLGELGLSVKVIEASIGSIYDDLENIILTAEIITG